MQQGQKLLWTLKIWQLSLMDRRLMLCTLMALRLQRMVRILFCHP